jgi:ribosomal protein L3 glutamine methyltransferase
VDISKEALAVAKINVHNHGVARQVTLIESDLFSELKSIQYDLIISNPPYVAQAEYESLPPEYQHEPRLALAAGEKGLAIIERILRSAADYLTSNGILIVEVGNTAPALIEKYPNLPFLWLEFERGGDGIFLLTREQLKGEGNESKI